MISEKVQTAINDQINAELYSAYLYLSMYAHFQSINLKGFANWMQIQAAEEFSHARKFYMYLLDRGGRVKLAKIEGPETSWKSPLEVFEHTYKHEQVVTARINNLMNLAMDERDHATMNMLQWFVSEQVEEEANANEITEKLKLVGENSSGLFMIDQELAARALDLTIFTGLVGTAQP